MNYNHSIMHASHDIADTLGAVDLNALVALDAGEHHLSTVRVLKVVAVEQLLAMIVHRTRGTCKD